MHQHAKKPVAFLRRGIVVSTTAVCAGFPSLAYALTLEDVVRGVENSTLATFFVGCATGAMIGGLVATMGARNERRELEETVREAQAAAIRAEALAHQIESQLQALGREPKSSAPNAPEAVKDTRKSVATHAAESKVVVAPRHAAVPAPQAAPVVPKPEPPAKTHVRRGAHEARPAGATAAEKSTRVRSPWQTGALLMERFGSGALANLPVIDRGAERDSTGAIVSELESTAPRRVLTRSSIIERRVPRLDESLFPDMRSDAQVDSDQFETAMRAMDDVMEHTAPQAIEEEGDFATVDPPAVFDASSYVDHLVRDELDRNRSGSARRFSRSHLKVFEGTGDLGIAKHAMPDEMDRISKEA